MSPLNFQAIHSSILSELEVKLKELIFASARHISPEGIVSTASKDLNLVVDHLKGSILYNGGQANNIKEVLMAAQLMGNLISGIKSEPVKAPEPLKSEVKEDLPNRFLQDGNVLSKMDVKAPAVVQEPPKPSDLIVLP